MKRLARLARPSIEQGSIARLVSGVTWFLAVVLVFFVGVAVGQLIMALFLLR